MTIKHKILLHYIKDLSVETPDPESLIAARENISKYSLKLDLTSKVLKNKMIEVDTKLTYEDKNDIWKGLGHDDLDLIPILYDEHYKVYSEYIPLENRDYEMFYYTSYE